MKNNINEIFFNCCSIHSFTCSTEHGKYIEFIIYGIFFRFFLRIHLQSFGWIFFFFHFSVIVTHLYVYYDFSSFFAYLQLTRRSILIHKSIQVPSIEITWMFFNTLQIVGWYELRKTSLELSSIEAVTEANIERAECGTWERTESVKTFSRISHNELHLIWKEKKHLV